MNESISQLNAVSMLDKEIIESSRQNYEIQMRSFAESNFNFESLELAEFIGSQSFGAI